MDFFLEGLQQAWDMIAARDPYLVHLVKVTLWVALVSTGISLVIGLPLALLLGLGRFRGRGVMVTFANAGLGLPPVVVGLVLALLMFPAAPLGSLHLLFTLEGVLIAQTFLALPIIVALGCASIREISPGLIAQARAFGAGRIQVSALALREARIGILAATIAAVGSGLSEVGAVVLVGGNIQGVNQTLASAALQQVEAGHFAEGLAIGILLLGLILIVVALLTVLQMAGSARRVGSSS